MISDFGLTYIVSPARAVANSESNVCPPRRHSAACALIQPPKLTVPGDRRIPCGRCVATRRECTRTGLKIRVAKSTGYQPLHPLSHTLCPQYVRALTLKYRELPQETKVGQDAKTMFVPPFPPHLLPLTQHDQWILSMKLRSCPGKPSSKDPEVMMWKPTLTPPAPLKMTTPQHPPSWHARTCHAQPLPHPAYSTQAAHPLIDSSKES